MRVIIVALVMFAVACEPKPKPAVTSVDAAASVDDLRADSRPDGGTPENAVDAGSPDAGDMAKKTPPGKPDDVPRKKGK